MPGITRSPPTSAVFPEKLKTRNEKRWPFGPFFVNVPRRQVFSLKVPPPWATLAGKCHGLGASAASAAPRRLRPPAAVQRRTHIAHAAFPPHPPFLESPFPPACAPTGGIFDQKSMLFWPSLNTHCENCSGQNFHRQTQMHSTWSKMFFNVLK